MISHAAIAGYSGGRGVPGPLPQDLAQTTVAGKGREQQHHRARQRPVGAAEGGAVVVLIIMMAQASFGYSGWGDAGGVPGGAPIPTVAGYGGMDLMAPTGEVIPWGGGARPDAPGAA